MVVVGVQEIVSPVFIFIGNYRGEIDIFYTAENILFHEGVDLLHSGDEVFDLHTLGGRRAIRAAGGAGVCKMAGTLNKVELIVISPVHNVRFADQVHGPDQLHAFKVRAVKLGHHGLNLPAVQHPHKNGFDHVIEVVSESNLIAAELLCLAVKVAAAHPGTEVAGRFFNLIDGIKNVRFEDCDRNSEHFGVFFDYHTVDIAVTRIHHQKGELEGIFIVALELLEKLGHQHGILAAGNADSDVVTLLEQIVGVDRLRKGSEQRFVEFFADAELDVFLPVPVSFPERGGEPGTVSAGKVRAVIALFPEQRNQLCALDTLHAKKNVAFCPVQASGRGLHGNVRHADRARDGPVGKGYAVPDIREDIFGRRKIRQLIYGKFYFFKHKFLSSPVFLNVSDYFNINLRYNIEKSRVCRFLAYRDFPAGRIMEVFKMMHTNDQLLLYGDNGIGIVLIHGVTSGCGQMIPFAKMLNDYGYSVRCVNIAGHGTYPQELLRTSYEDMIDKARYDYEMMKRHYEKVYLGGLSMGGCLTLALASRFEDVDGIISISAPLKLMPDCFIATPYPEDQVYLHRPMEGKVGTARHYHVHYEEIPIKVFGEIKGLMGYLNTEGVLEKIQCPAFVAQALDDDIADPVSGKEIMKRISSKDACYYEPAEAGHQIQLREGRFALMQNLVPWLDKQDGILS